MLFNFQLFPFSELMTEIDYREASVEKRGHRQVSWYVLSDGWYWMDVGSTHLFRYTQQAHDLVQPLRSENEWYVDYFVSRFWEDILLILPALLEPLPPPLIERLSSISDWNDWLADKEEVWEVHNCNSEEKEDAEDEYEQEVVYLSTLADDWWYARCLDTAYLISGPRIWFWSDGTLLYIGWDNRERLFEGISAWEAGIGQIVLPVTQFLTELHAFNQQLMDTMATRTTTASTYWPGSQLANDLDALQEEQQERSTWLANALLEAKNREATNWQGVLTSITIIENDPVFIDIHAHRNER